MEHLGKCIRFRPPYSDTSFSSLSIVSCLLLTFSDGHGLIVELFMPWRLKCWKSKILKVIPTKWITGECAYIFASFHMFCPSVSQSIMLLRHHLQHPYNRSLGVLMWEMATGQPPFTYGEVDVVHHEEEEEEEDKKIRQDHLERIIATLPLSKAHLEEEADSDEDDDGFLEVIQGLLQIDPKERYGVEEVSSSSGMYRCDL